MNNKTVEPIHLYEDIWSFGNELQANNFLKNFDIEDNTKIFEESLKELAEDTPGMPIDIEEIMEVFLNWDFPEALIEELCISGINEEWSNKLLAYIIWYQKTNSEKEEDYEEYSDGIPLINEMRNKLARKYGIE